MRIEITSQKRAAERPALGHCTTELIRAHSFRPLLRASNSTSQCGVSSSSTTAHTAPSKSARSHCHVWGIIGTRAFSSPATSTSKHRTRPSNRSPQIQGPLKSHQTSEGTGSSLYLRLAGRPWYHVGRDIGSYLWHLSTYPHPPAIKNRPSRIYRYVENKQPAHTKKTYPNTAKSSRIRLAGLNRAAHSKLQALIIASIAIDIETTKYNVHVYARAIFAVRRPITLLNIAVPSRSGRGGYSEPTKAHTRIPRSIPQLTFQPHLQGKSLASPSSSTT